MSSTFLDKQPEAEARLQALYQELIIDHGTRPRNFRVVDGSNLKGQGYNPLCGDKIDLFLRLEGEHIKDIGFQGQGCAISTASASLMTEIILGKTKEEALRLFKDFKTLMTLGETCDCSLGKLSALSGVHAFPMRVKCATLPWHTLNAALASEPSETPWISTE